MVFEFLNRLIGHRDSSVDAVNAYVEGSASADEQTFVERMMRENPGLEKDLGTQRALLEVLRRVEKVEAPRSFTVTPELIARAERSDSALSRVAELFGPQRKLALAPAVIAGIAALSVALLTLGDITGVVDQTSGGDDSASVAVVVESAASIGALGIAGETGESGAPAAGGTSDDSTFLTEKASQSGGAGAAATAAPARATAPEVVTESAAPGPLVTVIVTEKGDAESSRIAPAGEPPSLTTEATAPVARPEEDVETSAKDGAIVEPANEDTEAFGTGGSIDTAGTADGAGEGALAGAGALEGVAGGAGSGTAMGAGKGLTLPLRQLQIALAALALAAIGAWAGLRRVRGE